MKPILSNLGFVMQLAGIFLIFPILIAFYFNEINALISFLITGFSFFMGGFIMNAFSDRRAMTYRQSCILLVLTFFIIPLLGSVPYIWNDPFGQTGTAERLTNSFFESVSGFTTTGFSLIGNLDAIPRSLSFYRSLTELIGGIGIVFLLLAFFYKGNTINNISRLLGYFDISSNLRKSLVSVILIYVLYIAAFTAALVFFLHTSIIDTVSTVLSGLMTGGLSPVSDFNVFLQFPGNFIVILSMILGATGFIIHYNLFTGKLRSAMKKEFLAFIIIIIASTLLLSFVYGKNLSESLFHVASASSTTGFAFWDFSSIDIGMKMVFISLMLIGGMGMSTSGGIKVVRLLVLLKSVPSLVNSIIHDKDPGTTFDGREYSVRDISINLLFILLSIVTVFVGATILATSGFPFTEALFEATSAFATTGLSVGIASVSSLLYVKWTLIFLMIIGRVEIIPFLIAFVGSDRRASGRVEVKKT